MPQPTPRRDGAQVFHVNFHTNHNRAVFEVPEHLDLLRRLLPQVLEKWEVMCLAWQVMPTHVHLVLLTFSDQPLGRVMRLIKGSTAHDVLETAPELRADLGNHLWQEGYDWVEVTTHSQCTNAVRYVRENRVRSGLE